MMSSRAKESKASKGSTEHVERIEHILLNHVKTTADKTPDSVLKTIDEFCWSGKWMMHVGNLKGDILDKVVTKMREDKKGTSLTVLELGTYCGYSTVRLARLVGEGGLVYTIDPSNMQDDVASKIVEHAGLSKKVRFEKGNASDVIPSLTELKRKIDVVFIDHEKDEYLHDLNLIEKHGLLHPGSVIVADNTVLFDNKEFIDHLYTSSLYHNNKQHLSTLEYSKEIEDGMEVAYWIGKGSCTIL